MPVSKSEMQELRDIYDEWDTNGNGTLDYSNATMISKLKEEFGFSDFGPVTETIGEMNSDGDGLRFHEFVKIYNCQEIYSRFSEVDTNDSGKISKGELGEIITEYLGGGSYMKLSDDEINNVIEDADYDGDGLISFSEFMQAGYASLMAEEKKSEEYCKCY